MQILFSVLKKYSKPKSWNYILLCILLGIFRTSSLEGSISSNRKRTSLGRQGEESGYIEVLQEGLRVLFVPSKSLFLQPCLSSRCCMVGLMVTSYKRFYVIPRYTAPRASDHEAGHCWPGLLQETLKHRFFKSLWDFRVLVCTRFCLRLLSNLGRYGVWF